MNRALFLDRDGVINVEINYLIKIEDFVFIDGIFELCKKYQDRGYLIFVVTNQSGIARGFYTQEDFDVLTSWMMKEFLNRGVIIKKVYFCPHHPEISGECSCRKPKAGMLLEAKKEFDIDLQNSILVGDKERDIEAALASGIKESYFFDEKGICKESKATKIISNLREV
ncbi:D-alpha,beta-D-heptose 1,7-bisphosphate phosphatase [Sulfurimonas denitrificans DSM 1251]|uniref:D,D-heptose 1,7-bisphosphate phosphatase n=1 Tax=Sulfurimonas denitrificans (strain ATCC 33889 / DSM 1251) TaxID=326298 RepID=Q30T28_SULDN|nr:D-glycero-beta-D-manno-heptose 1,7-bisphosphate 7-phosphatase [Sulfurimonas denitrificans]ABB43853.1 D-alpha,beta-D-heptose 1,7-bisphosphate phosphatase [Sulfurimonas denitrificans DSM 1251]MDD3442328.1 D-glycero-beta-D-manno-heptose 1,7-bisphosphate 7-phosphatase [Sulfurimonas denitrificans]